MVWSWWVRWTRFQDLRMSERRREAKKKTMIRERNGVRCFFIAAEHAPRCINISHSIKILSRPTQANQNLFIEPPLLSRRTFFSELPESYRCFCMRNSLCRSNERFTCKNRIRTHLVHSHEHDYDISSHANNFRMGGRKVICFFFLVWSDLGGYWTLWSYRNKIKYLIFTIFRTEE